MHYDVGIDVGAVSINCIVIDDEQRVVYAAPYIRHFGLIHEETSRIIKKLVKLFHAEEIHSITFTGIHGELFSKMLKTHFEVETITQVLGTVHVVPDVRTIISIGGQTAAFFQVSHNNGRWDLENFTMNGPCAAGTGSFIDQQAERLASSLYEEKVQNDQHKVQQVLADFIALGLKSSNPAPVACRCTVFTKSDMIHLQNRGEALTNIIAGLHYGNAANYMSTVVGNQPLSDPVVFIGGVASNELQVRAFKNYVPEITVPCFYSSMGALGAALQSQKMGWKSVVDLSELDKKTSYAQEEFPRAARLGLTLSDFPGDNSLSVDLPLVTTVCDVCLGIDIGSTTTKYVLIDSSNSIVHKNYVQTRGKPIEVTQQLLKTVLQETGNRIRIMGIATTGSGRKVVGAFFDADLILDEITAHARGAVEMDPEVDTVFEIGGQDSKYISITATHPLDFDMNKVCAAGTGSFLHELANKMKINIVNQFQDVALSAENPVYLTDRCTVFMESDLISYLRKGVRSDDLIAGLCYAIVNNYLNRVVGKHAIGNRIMFLGGPSLNKGIVAAFENVLKKPVIIPKHREVLGAFGAALVLKDRWRNNQVVQRERALSDMVDSPVQYEEKICRADKTCRNECKLKIYTFGTRKCIWGGDCGRYETKGEVSQREENLFQKRQDLFNKCIEDRGICVSGSNDWEHSISGPAVGIPSSLYFMEWGIFWVQVFSELGFTVILSPPTNQEIVMRGVRSMTAETCFPVKVFHGHVHYLLNRADYLFLPSLLDMPTPASCERGLFCPFVSSSQYIVKAALRIPENRLIRPILNLKKGIEGIGETLFRSVRAKTGQNRKDFSAILQRAWKQQMTFGLQLRRQGEAFLRDIPGSEPVWIVSGRPYNLYDDRCNLSLGRQLSRLGIKAMPIDFLDLDGENLSDFPNMYWGSGSRILRAAKRIARTSNFYGVHITNFGCGVDSFIEHFYCHILRDKPSLILEFDEHSAEAGLITRLEAYRNIVHNILYRDRTKKGIV